MLNHEWVKFDEDGRKEKICVESAANKAVGVVFCLLYDASREQLGLRARHQGQYG